MAPFRPVEIASISLRLSIAAAFERELPVVDAARDVGGEHDRRVDRDRRVFRAACRGSQSERQNKDRSKATFRPAAHRIFAAP